MRGVTEALAAQLNSALVEGKPSNVETGNAIHRTMGRLAARRHGQNASEWVYDGLELATWGDHFDVPRALKDVNYRRLTGHC